MGSCIPEKPRTGDNCPLKMDPWNFLHNLRAAPRKSPFSPPRIVCYLYDHWEEAVGLAALSRVHRLILLVFPFPALGDVSVGGISYSPFQVSVHRQGSQVLVRASSGWQTHGHLFSYWVHRRLVSSDHEILRSPKTRPKQLPGPGNTHFLCVHQ